MERVFAAGMAKWNNSKFFKENWGWYNQPL